MSDGIWSAASGAMSQLTILDTAANNVANTNTNGYKTEAPLFRQVMSNAAQRNDVRLVQSAGTTTDVTQGGISQTGRGLDAAISGPGFFRVKVGDEEQYTRAGAFDISPDGKLTDKVGAPLLDGGGQPISVPREAKAVEIAHDGSVIADGAKVGTLSVVDFDKPGALERTEAQRFRANSVAGAPRDLDPKLEGGALEQSNASPVRAMVDIVAAVRGFDVCEKAVEAFRDADMHAAQSLMKTG